MWSWMPVLFSSEWTLLISICILYGCTPGWHCLAYVLWLNTAWYIKKGWAYFFQAQVWYLFSAQAKTIYWFWAARKKKKSNLTRKSSLEDSKQEPSVWKFPKWQKTETERNEKHEKNFLGFDFFFITRALFHKKEKNWYVKTVWSKPKPILEYKNERHKG